MKRFIIKNDFYIIKKKILKNFIQIKEIQNL